MTGDTVEALKRAFIQFAREEGELATSLMVVEREHMFRMPDSFPPKIEKQVMVERNRRFKCILPELKVPEAMDEITKGRPQMRRDYMLQLAEAIVNDVDFQQVG